MPHRAVIAGLIGIALALFNLPALATTTHQCADLPVQVISAPASLSPDTCLAAAAALRFLERYQLRPKRQILVEIVDEPLDAEGHPIYGSYDYHADRVKIMSMSAINQYIAVPTMYDEPFNEEQYRGVVAHELTHAVVQHNTALDRVSNAAQEYLAHATQLGVLQPALRERIIAAAGVGPWKSNDVISEIYMAFAPNRFAVKCYLHLTQLSSVQPFIRLLLTHKWHYLTAT